MFFIGTNHNHSQSIYLKKIEDKKAVYFLPDQFNIHADGLHDDSEALQMAINKVEENGKFGIVFIPEGTYLLNKTIYVWKGIRLIGYGKNRPQFIRDGNNSGFNALQDKYMVHFANEKRKNGRINDANASTFYSAISNIDFKVKNGNNSMVCIRSNYAQHCFISYCDFEIGSGLAAIEQVGNEISNCKFFNGEYAISAFRTAPGWPLVLMDSYFQGQKKAAIETQDAGLTIIRTHFKNTPSAIVTRPDKPEKLYMEDCRFEKISNAALVIDDELSAYSQYNIKNLIGIDVPLLVKLRKSSKEIRVKSSVYRVVDFSHGLQIQDLGHKPILDTNHQIISLAKIPPLPLTDVLPIPDQEQWTNMSDLGIIGDAEFDNTKIIQDAVNKHDVLYFPSGRYRITDKIVLKPNTVLLGLNPIATQILIKDETQSYSGTGNPKALIETAVGGDNIISGIGIDAGGINPRAVGIKWMASAKSLLNDVKFMGGHGTYDTEGNYLKIYNNNRTADSDENRKWDSQYWSLWVTNGGGVFKNIWSASPFAQAGFYVSNTAIPGRVYGMSLEHHVRHEAQFKNVSNWKMYAFQTEEEPGEGWNALPILIDNSSNLLFANTFFYRTSRMHSPYPYAVLLKKASNIEFCNVHSYSSTRFVFDATVFDADFNFGIRSLEISNLKISGNPTNIVAKADFNKVNKVATGFEFIDALTADKDGNVYFNDSRWHKIFKHAVGNNETVLLCDLGFSPSGLAVDKANNLLVKTAQSTFISLDLSKNPIEEFEVLTQDSTMGLNNKWVIYPAYLHSSIDGFYNKLKTKKADFFHNKEGSTTIVNTNELREPHNLGIAIPGKKFYIIQDEMHKTYSFDVLSNGDLSNPLLFAEKGDCQAIEDKKGQVYIVDENILVYDAKGNYLKTIEVPERPSSITFGGKNGNTLFISARTSLYSVEIE